VLHTRLLQNPRGAAGPRAPLGRLSSRQRAWRECRRVIWRGKHVGAILLELLCGGRAQRSGDQPARAVWRSWVGGHTDHFLARSTQRCVLLRRLPEDLVQSSGDEDVHRSLLKRLWRRAGNGRSGARHTPLYSCCLLRAAALAARSCTEALESRSEYKTSTAQRTMSARDKIDRCES
jgi:hypothetical protein